MSTSTRSRMVLLVSRDLFFTSMVSGTASLLGVDVQIVTDAAAAAQRLATGQMDCLFVDLADSNLDVAALFASLPTNNRPPVVAIGSHVATARLQEARDAGCDEVLPRSRFSASLPELLKKYCGP